MQAVPIECPHCRVLSQHQKVAFCEGSVAHVRDSLGEAYTSKLVHLVLRCLNCSEDTYIVLEPQFRRTDGHVGSKALPGSEDNILHIYPTTTPILHEAVPIGIRDAASEAEKCLGAGANNACGVMTRRAMHSLCGDKKAEGKDLFAQLHDLKSKGVVTPDLWEWAEELRVLGRNGAHHEWQEVTSDDAEYGVKFLREIVRYVYINPYERSQKRLKETSKKA